MLKKLSLTVALVVSAVSVFAQGSVNFNNGGLAFKTTADRNVYFGAVGTANGGTLLVGTKFKVQLYVGADASSLEAINVPFASFRASAGAGTWSGGNRDLVTPTTTYPQGAQVFLAVRAWDSTTGASWETAAIRGSSTPFAYTAPPAGTLDATQFYMENLRAFAVVPEPGTFALAGLGILGLVMARRRK